MEKYIVISKEPVMDVSMKVGKKVLMSFAQKPLWKAFYWIKVQNDTLPACYDKATAEYAIRKYANTNNFEVMEYSQALKEFKAYKYT